MDYKQVVEFSLDFVRTNRVAGEAVIRDLAAKSKILGWADWMKCLEDSLSHKTYNEIRVSYKEHRKPDYGFTLLDARQGRAMDRFYADAFSLADS